MSIYFHYHGKKTSDCMVVEGNYQHYAIEIRRGKIRLLASYDGDHWVFVGGAAKYTKPGRPRKPEPVEYNDD